MPSALLLGWLGLAENALGFGLSVQTEAEKHIEREQSAQKPNKFTSRAELNQNYICSKGMFSH